MTFNKGDKIVVKYISFINTIEKCTTIKLYMFFNINKYEVNIS